MAKDKLSGVRIHIEERDDEPNENFGLVGRIGEARGSARPELLDGVKLEMEDVDTISNATRQWLRVVESVLDGCVGSIHAIHHRMDENRFGMDMAIVFSPGLTSGHVSREKISLPAGRITNAELVEFLRTLIPIAEVKDRRGGKRTKSVEWIDTVMELAGAAKPDEEICRLFRTMAGDICKSL